MQTSSNLTGTPARCSKFRLSQPFCRPYVPPPLFHRLREQRAFTPGGAVARAASTSHQEQSRKMPFTLVYVHSRGIHSFFFSLTPYPFFFVRTPRPRTRPISRPNVPRSLSALSSQTRSSHRSSASSTCTSSSAGKVLTPAPSTTPASAGASATCSPRSGARR